jgi:opacity protein-like surface antigen
MRFRVVVCIAVLLLVSPAGFAQSNRVSLYVANPGHFGGGEFGSHYTGGAALSLSHFWTPRFSTEVVVAAERDYDGYVLFNRDGSVREKQEFGYTTYPIDLLVQYQFRTDSRWRPYAGAGMRYVNRPSAFRTGTKFAGELDGGVLFMIKPRLALVFDGRLSAAHSTNWNPSFKPSVGLGWRF